jgi:hypothetical protein
MWRLIKEHGRGSLRMGKLAFMESIIDHQVPAYLDKNAG